LAQESSLPKKITKKYLLISILDFVAGNAHIQQIFVKDVHIKAIEDPKKITDGCFEQQSS
jgi:hypothetical protein